MIERKQFFSKKSEKRRRRKEGKAERKDSNITHSEITNKEQKSVVSKNRHSVSVTVCGGVLYTHTVTLVCIESVHLQFLVPLVPGLIQLANHTQK